MREQIAALRLKTAGLDVPVTQLSGGNQQKVILGRWLLARPRLLLLDEPTRGIDVGARAEIYELIRALVEQGMGVLLASSDLPEVLGLCHRVIVLREGHRTGGVALRRGDPGARDGRGRVGERDMSAARTQSERGVSGSRLRSPRV